MSLGAKRYPKEPKAHILKDVITDLQKGETRP